MNELIKKYLPKAQEGQVILDLGCGDGSDAAYASSLGYKVDAKDRVYNVAESNVKDNIHYDTVNIRDMKLAIQYNYIFVMNVLMFLSKREAVDLLQRLKTALKPKGTMIISVFSNADPSFNQEMGYFTLEELKTVLSGFTFLHAQEKAILDEHGGRRHVHALTEVVVSL